MTNSKLNLVFKKVFREHKDILKNFLNSMLPLPEGGEIDSFTYLTLDFDANIQEDRDSIIDISCTDKDGSKFIVEVQLCTCSNSEKKTFFDVCEAYTKCNEKAYGKMLPIYELSILNEDLYPEFPEDFYHEFSMSHITMSQIKYNDQSIGGMTIVFVELPKFKRQTKIDDNMRSLWLRFITELNEDKKDLALDFKKNIYIAKTISILEEQYIE